MQEAAETISVEETVEQTTMNDFKPKPINMGSLPVGARAELSGGLKDALQNHKSFQFLGAQQKVIFYDVCNMIKTDVGITMLNITGEEFYEMVSVPNQKKKERQKFVRFVFDYIIPGTSNKLSVEKVWRYEDFPQ